MFDKEKFAKIIKKISETYENQREFSSLSEINRTYLSQYMNMKIDNPPKPDILKKLADASKGIVTYEELMFYCGYTDNYPLNLTSEKIFFDKYVPILKEINLSENDITQFKEILLNITTNDGLNSNISEFISKFSSEKQKILNNIQEKMAEKLWANLKQKKFKSTIFNCPVYGKISAGIPNWAEECLEGYLPIDPNLFGIVNPDECFFLLVNGQSMNKVIRNGAYALIRKQDIVENGEICAVLVNGFEATLKKFSKQGDLVILEPMSDDPSFTTQVYNKDTQIRILGKYIGKFEMNK